MNDHQLRVSLNDHNVLAGPVIGKYSSLHPLCTLQIIAGHTRAIYQRKLLEAITNENSEGKNY